MKTYMNFRISTQHIFQLEEGPSKNSGSGVESLLSSKRTTSRKLSQSLKIPTPKIFLKELNKETTNNYSSTFVYKFYFCYMYISICKYLYRM